MLGWNDVKRSRVNLWVVEGFVPRGWNCAGVGLASADLAEQLLEWGPLQSQT